MGLRFYIIIFLIGFQLKAFSFKSKEDSLIHELTVCKNDSLRFRLSDKLYTIYSRRGNFHAAKIYNDSLFVYANRLNISMFWGFAFASKANYFYRTGKLDSAIVYNNKAITIANKINYYGTLTKCHINLGNIYNQKADYKKSIIYFQMAERYADVSKDTLGKISAILNLGNVFFGINDYVFAKKNYLKVIQNAKALPGAKNELSTAYNNLGTVFLNQLPKQVDSALIYYNKFLDESLALDNQNSVALAYFNIAEVYRLKQEFKKAEDFYFKSRSSFEEMEDSVGIIKVLLGVADNYELQNKHLEAIAALRSGINYCQTNEMQSYLVDFYKNLGLSLYNIKSYKEGFDYFETGVRIEDSLYNAENSEILYELQTKYETTEKEKQNILLTSQNEISQKTIKQQRLVTSVIVIGLALSLLFGFFIFRGLKQQRKANRIITEQKKEVEHQKLLVEEHQKEILDSIHYAKRIQNTLLAHQDFLNENLQENFVLYQPKDIVSGDFYWATKRGDKFYFAICDSTGHGVPGAFMSLLNTGFLNEAINEKGILQPNEIFNYVRSRLVTSISKEEQKDGFDGILLCFDKTTNHISYAAAHNSPVLFSQHKLIELPKDKMPVGKGEKEDAFNLYTIDTKPGDILYLYTDGYADQFGGPKGKKFKYKTLHELVLKNSHLSLQQQAETLSNEFNTWKGNLEQVDDVLVVGIKF